ncbi:MAG TPA: extracellular solute-binding protein, partial [Chloroflexota bacterium]|nr:extracellular solute-binding protein [Chloroflexota bacterium]
PPQAAATGQAEAAPVTLDWWNETDMDQPAEEAIKADWAQRFPRITLQPTKVPYGDYTKKILTVLVADTAPDVTYTHQDWTATFAQKRVVAPLDELVKRDRTLKLSDYYPAAIDFQRWGGKLYGLSWIMEGSTLFYNRNLIEQAGLEDPNALDKRGQWTLERFQDHLNRLARLTVNQQRVWGWTQGVTGKMSSYLDTIWAFGAEALTPDGMKLALQSPPAVEALTWLVANYQQRLTTAGDPDSRGVTVDTGRIGFVRANRLHFTLNDGGRWGNVYFPVGRNGKRAHRAGCSGHGIVAQSKKEAPAWELVKHLSQQGNRIATARSFAVPLWPAVAESKEFAATVRPFEDAATFAQLGKTIKVMVPPPGLAADSGIDGWQGYTAIAEQMNRVLAGQVTVKDAMEQAAKNCEQIVAEAMR